MSKKLVIGPVAKGALWVTAAGLRSAAARLPEVVAPLPNIFASTLDDVAEAGTEDSDEGATVTRSEVYALVMRLIDALQEFGQSLVE